MQGFKKFFPLIAMLLVALFVFAACGGGDTTPVASPPPVVQQTPPPTGGDVTPPPTETETEAAWSPHDIGPATIRFAWWGGDARHEAVNAAIDVFVTRYPHITVEREYGAFGGYLESLVVQMAGQAEADVIQVNYAWVHALGGGINVFADLRNYAHIIDLDEWTPALRNFTTTTDGQLAGVPHGITGRVIIYNQELLAQHGLTSFPATFDEWIAWGEQVAEGNLALDQGNNMYGFFPIGPQSLDIVMLTMLYNHTGRNMVDANGQRIQYTIDEVEYMFNIWQRMIDVGALPTWDQQEGVSDVFNPVWMEGRGGSVFEWVGNIFLAGGAFMDNNVAERRVDGIGVALLPATTPGGTRASMQRPSLVHVVSRNSNNPELAAYFLNFMYTDEEALLILGNQFGIPLSRTAAAIFEREGGAWGLQLDGFELLEANQGRMQPLFEDPNLRPAREAAIEAFRTGVINAREAATRWVNDQQAELDFMQ
jgi:oligogalacturonide transport system substrate-binding protein